MIGGSSYALGPHLDVLRELWALDHAATVLSRRMSTLAGMSMQQRILLRIVGRFPSITPGRVADLMHLDAGTVSTSIRNLESKGWLVRRREPRDKRLVSLGLTQEGHRIDSGTTSPTESAIARALARLDASDVAVFQRVIAVFIAELSAELPGLDDDASSSSSNERGPREER